MQVDKHAKGTWSTRLSSPPTHTHTHTEILPTQNGEKERKKAFFNLASLPSVTFLSTLTSAPASLFVTHEILHNTRHRLTAVLQGGLWFCGDEQTSREGDVRRGHRQVHEPLRNLNKGFERDCSQTATQTPVSLVLSSSKTLPVNKIWVATGSTCLLIGTLGLSHQRRQQKMRSCGVSTGHKYASCSFSERCLFSTWTWTIMVPSSWAERRSKRRSRSSVRTS